MRQIVVDTETTGLQVEEGHRIIEIAGIELINRKFTGRRYQQYINPEREIDQGALAVHGITNTFLESKPVFATIAAEFIDFIQGAELIIHNAAFDVKFIQHELNLTNKEWKPLTEMCRIIDTLVLARQLHVGQRNNLDALCKRYRIDHSERNLHGALLDANLLAQVYLAMTGGQGSLFDEPPARIEDIKEEKNQVRMVIKEKNGFVLMADAEEYEAHRKQLEKLREKGKCLWN
jgi:DNA polymerase-3 subunit epsilon